LRFLTKKPLKEHIPCSKAGCPNYYNSRYKDANGLCKPCNRIKKEKDEKA